MLRRALILACVLVAPSVSFAQGNNDVRARGDRACGNDSTRLCRSVLSHGDMAILGCLQQNAKKLSKSCRTFLKEQGQLWD